MTYNAGTTAAIAHIQNVIKMSGAFVKISPEDFQNVLAKAEGLMVIESKTGVFTSKFLYVTSCKGFYFFCKSKSQLMISSKHDKVFAESVQLPTM